MKTGDRLHFARLSNSPDLCLVMVVFDGLNTLVSLVEDEEPVRVVVVRTVVVPGSLPTEPMCFVTSLSARLPCVTVLIVWLVMRLVRTIVL